MRFADSFYKQIDAAIQQGKGAAAQVLGQPYNVFRLTSTTNNGVVTGTPTHQNFPVRLRRTTSRVAIENATFDLQVYEATCDRTYLLLGDTLVEQGYLSDGGTYVMAQQRPTRETLFVRTEFNCAITRPHSLAGRQDQQPASGAVVMPGYAGTVKSQEQILTLTNGLYSFQDTGVEASVPVGLQPLNRIRDGKNPAIPTVFSREHFLMYLPLMPGVQIQELDVINLPNSDRYEVALVYTSDQIGLTGYILIVEKMGV